ncbi:hypothetical protein [Streptomyces sp. NPDC059176]|uniref:hypothetical protein n=1 Tax=Streptomyces sp. NPDC059176 TaxID=3346758 RepID=UPI003679A0B1
MNAIRLLAKFVASGQLHGIGIGSPLSEVDKKINSDFIDVTDEAGLSLRRDYGFVEFYFNPDTEWVVTGGAVELHKLAGNSSLADRWKKNMHIEFPQYVTWHQLKSELMEIINVSSLIETDQAGFIEYRMPMTRVSVLVSDDHEERDEWVGHGDVWSVSLG